MESKRQFVTLPVMPLFEAIEAIAFWSAIALPFVYLPLLAGGLDSQTKQLDFAVLVGLNAFAIVLGHRYGQ
jgi:hypothetical protein